MQAIVLNGNDVIKVTNLKRKRKKIETNPLMTILEEFDSEIPESRFQYWKSKYQKKEKEIITESGNYPKIMFYEISREGAFYRAPHVPNVDCHVTCVYDNPKYNVSYDVTRNSK